MNLSSHSHGGLQQRELPVLTDWEFTLFQKMVYREAGIWLSGAKKALVAGRLNRRLRELGLHTYAQYYRKFVALNEAERVHMLDCISTNETHFFREPRHFEFLARRVYPAWLAEAAAGQRARQIRIWSAGCSTGEEPYSLAMSLLAADPSFAAWDIQILATDISTRVLRRAQEGIWPLEKANELPVTHLKRFMLKGTEAQAGKMKIVPEIRSKVRFLRVNLNDRSYPVAGSFDLIFCRNVLIYFDAASKQHVLSALLKHLAADGYLFVGHAENLSLITDKVQTAAPTIYAHRLRERGGIVYPAPRADS